ncbi:uncharacterized protein DUF2478 [Aliiruegeria haliotis]|uniref:Uncharacterized protein DUF2478 n=1 Tax=Aliiruegeria haliotis TaxID=1280846 RepID=A0A2T0RJR1_9RHOB|nr:DUF2478 domain-containing protein [Aliiruegeria haliotis]PRY21425.1 uncharacterized protein DUF2478 [Aliiruegeria haliotis]
MRLAYITSDTPGQMNTTLRTLAETVSGQGRRVVGAVQVNSEPEGDELCDKTLLLLPEGPQICISQTLGPGSTGCRLDTDALARAVQHTAGQLDAGADLLIVNKFGSHEAEGRGFRDLIGTALAREIPVVVGVTSAKRDDFLQFAGDLGTQIECDVEQLTNWAVTPPDIAQ